MVAWRNQPNNSDLGGRDDLLQSIKFKNNTAYVIGVAFHECGRNGDMFKFNFYGPLEVMVIFLQEFLFMKVIWIQRLRLL